MTDDRAEMQEARTHGLKARHETREARAVRKAVAEEIAKALEAYLPYYSEEFFPADGTSVDCIAAKAMRHAYPNAARIAREIGSEDPE